jgi:ribosomal protein S18 acetylase RimI-like enzyme
MRTAIRRVTEADREALANFFEANNRPEITNHFHPFPLTTETARLVTDAGQLDRYYVATVDETIVGFCMLRGWADGFEIPSFGVFVDHAHHGHGCGKQLTEFAIAEAERLRCPALRLTVYESNVAARQLYDALGFTEVERSSVTRMGKPDSRIVMSKNLNQ